MNNETEKYLQDICFEENPQVLDDDRPDYFDVWLASQEPEDWLLHIDTILTLKNKQIEEAKREEVVLTYMEVLGAMFQCTTLAELQLHIEKMLQTLKTNHE